MPPKTLTLHGSKRYRYLPSSSTNDSLMLSTCRATFLEYLLSSSRVLIVSFPLNKISLADDLRTDKVAYGMSADVLGFVIEKVTGQSLEQVL